MGGPCAADARPMSGGIGRTAERETDGLIQVTVMVMWNRDTTRPPPPRAAWPAAAALLTALSVAAVPAAACPTDAQIDGWAAAWIARTPLDAPPRGLGYADALCGQRKLAARLGAELGPKVGWKVGLTNPEMQRRFGVEAPVRGILLAGMLLPDGATVPARFAARPAVEADLIVSIRDEGIMRATTPQEAARHVEDLIPFIELADLAWAADAPVDYAALVTVNAGARLGVLGRRMRLPQTPEFVDALAEMTVVIEDGVSPPAKAEGRTLMTHPFWPLIWLARDLAAQGETLRAGDLVSLGSFAPPRTPVAGATLRVRYEGLPDVPTPRVSVSFD